MELPRSDSNARPARRLGARGSGRAPLYGRSLLTSVAIHGTIFCGALLLSPGLREAAGRAMTVSSLVFASPEGAPEPMVAEVEPWEEVTAEPPPEPELVEVPMEPAPHPELDAEPELEAVEDMDRVWARVDPGPLVRILAPAAAPAPSLPPSVEPRDDGETTAPVLPAATPPVLVSAPPPSYPEIARRTGLEGSVLLRLRISDKGELFGCEVLESSGHERLDRAAIDAVRRWTFLPATTAGVATAGELLHRVTFGLQT